MSIKLFKFTLILLMIQFSFTACDELSELDDSDSIEIADKRNHGILKDINGTIKCQIDYT